MEQQISVIRKKKITEELDFTTIYNRKLTKEIKDLVETKFSNIEEKDVLNSIVGNNYIIPRIKSDYNFDNIEFSKNSIKEIICHPTGYKEINKNWLIENNPWRTLAQEYQGYDLYSTTRTFAVESDRELLELYNNTKKNDNHKYHLEIPAEPWQGNPLTAKIIILSLNPGWQEKYNKDIALEISKKRNITESIFKEKQRTLLFEADGFFPYDKKIVDAISMIGENYWRGDDKKAGRLSVLKPDTMDEFDFYKKFAVVQYCGYTSKEYGGGFDNGKYLPTQIFTKELIRYIAYNRPYVKFVILRAKDKWKNLLDADVWETMLPNTIIAKYPIQQRISRVNLGEDKFEELMNIIKE